MSEEAMTRRKRVKATIKTIAICVITGVTGAMIGGTIISSIIRERYTLIQVCEVESGLIMTIPQSALDREHYSTNLLDCARPGEHDTVISA